MDFDKHIPLADLMALLSKGINAVNNSYASKEEIQEMLSLSRELHERLAVLRFKAFEASVLDVEATSEAELLDEDVSESQIDLIDSIKEVSLAEKHQHKPLSSVGEGLTILERANYTSILFSNDDTSFNDMLDEIDLCQTVDDATKLFRNSIKPSGRKEDIDFAMNAFEERIPRIFS